jgi:transcriptional regulator with XRE-family HTH domain
VLESKADENEKIRKKSEGVIRVARSIGANIKARRHALGMTQRELAERLGVTQANVSRVESSQKGPGGEMLLSIAGALGCDVNDLLGVEANGDSPRDLDEDAKTFVLNAIKGDPQFGIYLRSFVKNSGSLTDEDWRFLASHLKLALGYAAEAIEAKRLNGNF